jgi:hypothetical protein
MTTQPASTGPSVRVDIYKLQCALRKEIPGGLTVDGVWGPQTKATLDLWTSVQSGGSFWYSVPARGATTVTLSTDVVVALFTPLRAGECDRPRAAPTSTTPTPLVSVPPEMAPVPEFVPQSAPTRSPASSTKWWWLGGAALVLAGVGVYYTTRRSRR